MSRQDGQSTAITPLQGIAQAVEILNSWARSDYAQADQMTFTVSGATSLKVGDTVIINHLAETYIVVTVHIYPRGATLALTASGSRKTIALVYLKPLPPARFWPVNFTAAGIPPGQWFDVFRTFARPRSLRIRTTTCTRRNRPQEPCAIHQRAKQKRRQYVQQLRRKLAEIKI